MFTKSIPVCMPDMENEAQTGPAVVQKWYIQEGSFVFPDDHLCDIDLPGMFTFGMSSDDEETTMMGKIVAREGDNVEPGDVLCTILYKEDDEEEEEN